MAKLRGAVDYKNVSQSTVITTTASIFYGCSVVNHTTGGVSVAIYDATATASGFLIDAVTCTAGTNANNGIYYPNGIICHAGIYLSALICTTAADAAIVYYGGL